MTEAKDILNKLARQEEEALAQSFLAPVARGGSIRLRIGGIIQTFDPGDRVGRPLRSLEGFYTFRIRKNDLHAWAEPIDKAPPTLVDQYLRLLPRTRFVVIGQFENTYYGITADRDSPPIPIRLAARIGLFDTVYARYDGHNVWFDRADRRRPPTIARELNSALGRKVLPDELHILGAVPQEHLAYRIAFIRLYEEVDNVPKDRISESLKVGGAKLNKYWESGKDRTTVQFTLEGTNHTVVVRSNDLTILSSGICLSGKDTDFDLTSLVSVFREKYGQDQDEED